MFRLGGTLLVSLRGATNGRDAAIHRVSKDAFWVCGSFTGSQWIATGYALAMTGMGGLTGRFSCEKTGSRPVLFRF